jgi:hypothetical protein
VAQRFLVRSRERGRVSLAVLGLVLGAVVVAALGMQAWVAWRQMQSVMVPPAVSAGTLCSVMLVNGQVYYGDFVDPSPGYISLRDVYYVQQVPAQAGAQPGNRLVSRRKVDWHAPLQMSIPAEKVMMIEVVGPGSRLAELVKLDRQAQPAQ